MKTLFFILVTLYLCVYSQSIVFAQPYRDQIKAERVEEKIPQFDGGSSNEQFDLSPPVQSIPDVTKQDSEKSNLSFKISQIDVENNSVFTYEQMEPLVKPALGNAVTLADLNQVADNITHFYREHGYVFSKAFIPKQKIKNNTVTIHIIEGYISEVELRGMKEDRKSTLSQYLEKLKASRPVTQDALERYIFLVNDLYGIKGQAILSLVDGQLGAVKLILLLDQTQNSTGFFLNNRGSDALGPMQATTFYKINDLFKAHEQTTLIYLTTVGDQELRYISLGQSWPIGPEGTRLSYNYSRSDAKPGEEAEDFGIESESNRYSVSVTHPWIRSRSENFSTSLSFDLRNSSTESFNTEIIDDHLRYVRLGGSYSRVHHKGLSSMNVDIAQGLPVMNATEKNSLMASRFGASGDALKLNGNFQRKQVLTESLNLDIKGTAQWAFSPLLSAELFGLGGNEYGRAFDFSTVTGDNGYALSAELSYAITTNLQNIDYLNIYGFIDGGQVYDDLNIVGNNWQTLSSGGTGIRIAVHDIVSANMEVAKPIKIEGANNDYSVQAKGNVGVRIDF